MTDNSSCINGGYYEEAFKYIIKNGGITTASNYRYKEADGNCDTYRASQHAAKIRGFVYICTRCGPTTRLR